MNADSVAVLRNWVDGNGGSGKHLLLWCPACEDVHIVNVEASSGPVWQWDGNLDAPTISPSILVGGVQWDESYSFHKPRHHVAPGEQVICHSYVKQGRWEFLGDCTHDLAGRTVPLVPLPEGMQLGRQEDEA